MRFKETLNNINTQRESFELGKGSSRTENTKTIGFKNGFRICSAKMTESKTNFQHGRSGAKQFRGDGKTMESTKRVSFDFLSMP